MCWKMGREREQHNATYEYYLQTQPPLRKSSSSVKKLKRKVLQVENLLFPHRPQMNAKWWVNALQERTPRTIQLSRKPANQETCLLLPFSFFRRSTVLDWSSTILLLLPYDKNERMFLTIWWKWKKNGWMWVVYLHCTRSN